MQDIDRLAKRLKKLGAGLRPSRTYSWGCPALDVISCVLSLNRPYRSFVIPRVERFAKKNPSTQSLIQLRNLIRRHRSPLAFSVAELRYRDSARAKTLLGVTEYLLTQQALYSGTTEAARLRTWARSVAPRDCREDSVRGFGIAGFQYLRMLCGAQTTKPDVYIKKFVANVIRRNVSAVDAVELLERAARKAKVPLRETDNRIWASMARD